MSSVQISGNASGAGVLTIAAPNTASNFTLTLPTQTGTLAAGANANSVTLPGATSGTVTLAAPAVAGTTTLTLQATTGTVALQGDVIGIGQTWQTFTVGSTRVSGTTYTNSTGKPIGVFIYMNSSSGSNSGSIVVGGITLLSWSNSATTIGFTEFFIVPPSSTYVVTAGSTANIASWAELR